MVPKQREMDDIVERIFQALETKEHLASTLLVVCGDHGMNDAGNHGASSPGETSPALLFMSPKLKSISPRYPAPATPKDQFEYYSKVEQSDIAPTIAALLGFPIPKNNLGAFIPEFLQFWPASNDKIQILIRNARQILNIVTAAFGSDLFDASSSVDPCSHGKTQLNELACEWQKINVRANSLKAVNEVDSEWVDSISQWLRDSQSIMSTMASNYNLVRLGLGQGLALASFVVSILAVYLDGTHRKGMILPLYLITASYGIMMFASSYVEEEHHFWYWSSTLWLTILSVREIRR